MNYLLLDFGSTYIKYGVYDVLSDSLSQEGFIPFPDKISDNNNYYFEVEPSEILKSFNLIIKEIACKDLKGIFISVQMHGYILTDKTGKLLTPYISWRDRRAEMLYINNKTYYDVFASKYNEINWSRRGTSSKPNLPLCSIYAQQYIKPEVVDKCCELYTLGSYVAYNLTGNNTTNITDCAASGFYNADSCLREDDIFPHIKIPETVGKVQVIGYWGGVPVYSPLGDHQVSFLGCSIQANEYLLNISTATQISTLSNNISEGYESRPYFFNERLCTVTNLIGGRIIREEQDTKALCDKLFENYSSALKILPKKEKIVVSGGAAQRFPDLINSVCDRIGIPYEVKNEVSAMNGLKFLAKEVCKNE